MSTVFEFGALLDNPLHLHPWMVQQQLLPEHVDCPECGATMKPAATGTTTLCCSKRTLHAENKAVKVAGGVHARDGEPQPAFCGPKNWGPHSADRESVEGPEKADFTRRGPKE